MHTWQAIAALSAAPATAAHDDVAHLGRACRWLALDTTSTWSWDVWWLSDAAPSCIGPEPERIAVVGATDTD